MVNNIQEKMIEQVFKKNIFILLQIIWIIEFYILGFLAIWVPRCRRFICWRLPKFLWRGGFLLRRRLVPCGVRLWGITR